MLYNMYYLRNLVTTFNMVDKKCTYFTSLLLQIQIGTNININIIFQNYSV